MTTNNIADALDIQPRSTQTIHVPIKAEVPTTTDELHDQTYKNIKNLAEIGEMAVYELAQLAAQTENPKAYEVLSKLMSEVISANEKLMDIKAKKIELDQRESGASSGPSTVNNNLFVGSTAEVLKRLNTIAQSAKGETNDTN